LPSLAGVGPKNQFGLPEPKTEAKKIRKNFVIFKKSKFIFWKGGLPPLAGVGPKNQLNSSEHKFIIRKN
jgi:hypothetical protein